MQQHHTGQDWEPVIFNNTNSEYNKKETVNNEKKSVEEEMEKKPTISLNNCTITDNLGVGLIIKDGSQVTMINSIYWFNESIMMTDTSDQETNILSVSYSDIQFGWDGEGNIDMDPRFCSPGDVNYYLSENSPPPKNPRLQYCIEEYSAGLLFSENRYVQNAVLEFKATDLGPLPKKVRGGLEGAIGDAELAIDSLEKAMSQETKIKQESIEYKPILRKVRRIESQINIKLTSNNLFPNLLSYLFLYFLSVLQLLPEPVLPLLL